MGREYPRLLERRSAISHRMRTGRQPGAVKVGNQALFGCHGSERRGSIDLRNSIEQRTRKAHGAFHLPQRIAAMQTLLFWQKIKLARHIFLARTADRIQRSDRSQQNQIVTPKFGYTMSQIGDRFERTLTAHADNCSCSFFAQPLGVTEAKAERETARCV